MAQINDALGTGGGERVAWYPTNATGMKALVLLGESLPLSRKNQAAPRQPKLAIPGSPPIIYADRATIGYGSRLTVPGLFEAANMTIFLCWKVLPTDLSAGSLRPSFGWYDGSGGVGIAPGGATNLRFYANFGSAAASQGTLPFASGRNNSIAMYALVIKDGVGMTLYNLTDGTSQTVPNTSARNLVTSRSFSVGGSQTGFGGLADHYIVSVQHTDLTYLQCLQNATDYAKLLKNVHLVTGSLPGY